MGWWLTPEIVVRSNPLECRTIYIQGDLWLYIQGALELLTMEHNWEDFGTATIEETTQHFMGILDNFSVSQCEIMQMIDVPNHTLINNVAYTQDGRVFEIDFADLPPEADGCTAIYVRLNILHNVANSVTQMNDKDGNAIVYNMTTTASVTHRETAIISMSGGSCEIRSLSANGTSVVIGAFLIGWWF